MLASFHFLCILFTLIKLQKFFGMPLQFSISISPTIHFVWPKSTSLANNIVFAFFFFEKGGGGEQTDCIMGDVEVANQRWPARNTSNPWFATDIIAAMLNDRSKKCQLILLVSNQQQFYNYCPMIVIAGLVYHFMNIHLVKLIKTAPSINILFSLDPYGGKFL